MSMGRSKLVPVPCRNLILALSDEASYRALCEGARASAPSFVAHLLAIPKSDEPDDVPRRVALRDVAL